MFSTLTLALAALSSSLMSYQTAQASIQAPQEVVRPQTTEEQALADEFPDAPIMQTVAKCESGAHQFLPNGKVVTNPKTSDYGVLQINQSHIKEAKSMGLDVSTLEGNIEYARILYDRSGLRDWLSSSNCWSAATGTVDIGHYSSIENAA